MPLQIAVIGSGIAGLGAAYRLTRAFGGHRVTVFEKDKRLGGHSATVDIVHTGEQIPVDTGFIVYNTLNYPRLTALFAELDVPTKPSDMGFALSLDNGRYEWAGQERTPIAGFLAQRRNIANPRHWRMLGDIIAFSRAAQRDLAAGKQGSIALEAHSLGDYIARGGWSEAFRDDYILPMGGAIWSMPVQSVLAFPALSFLRFFDNHRLLSRERPTWRTVDGGSRVYVDKLVRASGHVTRAGDPVVTVRRVSGGVEVVQASGDRSVFHKVILACHSDEALRLIALPTPDEHAALSSIRFAPNDVWLHRDPAWMPQRKAAWSAWNVLRKAQDGARPVTVSYWMNALQGIDASRPVFITLNPAEPPREDLIFARFNYAHPQYDAAAIGAQGRMPALQGAGGIYFAGAWMGHGFHEDGLRAGQEAADQVIRDVASDERNLIERAAVDA